MKVDEERIYSLVQGVLAIVVVGTACTMAVVSVLRGQPVLEIPAWLAGAIGVILGFFYGQTAASRFRQGVHTATNGMLDGARKIAAGQVAQANGNAAEESRGTG